MDQATVDALTDIVLLTLERGEPPAPAALTLLVRQYEATGRDDVRQALEGALVQAVGIPAACAERPRRAEWLQLLLEVRRVSEDQRVIEACDVLAGDLQREWPSGGDLETVMRSIDACLASGAIAPAVDELERVVALAYSPGSGVAHAAADPRGARGGLGDHVSTAAALLTAFSATGRLPYAMLAEELMQFALRTFLATGAPNPEPGTRNQEPLVQFARVCCRLAAIHDDADYQAAAVLADHDYAADAERTLASLAGECRGENARGAIYGVALLEWFAVRRPWR